MKKTDYWMCVYNNKHKIAAPFAPVASDSHIFIVDIFIFVLAKRC